MASSSRPFPGKKFESNWKKHILQAITSCLSSLSTPTSVLTLSLWADLVFSSAAFIVAVSHRQARWNREKHAVGLKKAMGWENFEASSWTLLLGGEHPLEPKWTLLWLELRPCFWCHIRNRTVATFAHVTHAAKTELLRVGWWPSLHLHTCEMLRNWWGGLFLSWAVQHGEESDIYIHVSRCI